MFNYNTQLFYRLSQRIVKQKEYKQSLMNKLKMDRNHNQAQVKGKAGLPIVEGRAKIQVQLSN